MIVYRNENEYCDADGNRGITVYEAELEPSDAEVICEKIAEEYEPGKKYYSITLQDDDGRVFEFDDVLITDWLTDEEIRELEKEWEAI